MKRVAIVLLIIVLLVGIIFGIMYFLPDNQVVVEPPEPSGEIEIKSPAEELVISTVSTRTQTQKRLVNAEIPHMDSLSNDSFQEEINDKIASLIKPYINEIAIVADDTISKQYVYEVSYERYNNENFVSLLIAQNYNTGGMRSNEWKDTFTIDVVKNKELTLKDVCSSKDYKKIIVDEVNKQARENNISLVAGNGLVDIPDSQRFYIKDEKLYIYFEPASIAPYLDGEMHFEMPYEFVDGEFILE